MEDNNVNSMEPGSRTLTDEEIAAMEKERQMEHDKEIAPYIEAARQRQSSAQIIEEHDNLLADMLYEITMNQFGEEV